MKNQYKQHTKILKIPVVGPKDAIWPDVEMRKWTLVENLLLASRKGVQNCIFKQGDIALKGNTVTLQANGEKPSAEGVVGGLYFKAKPIITWELPEGEPFYYLYVTSTTKTYGDPSAIRAVASPNKYHSKYVLFATVDMKNMELDRNPAGKIFSGDVAKHVGALENPHGEKLIQDEIEVKKLMVAGKEMKAPGFVDFVTAGVTGVVVTADVPVSFVQVSRSGPVGSDSIGEVSIGYFGSDEKAVNPEDFVVYNGGNTGLNARALIF